MRAGVIQRVVSRLLWFCVVALVVPLAFSMALAEPIWFAWAIPALLAGVLAFCFSRLPAARAAPEQSLKRREGFLAVTLGWIVIVFFTALALHLSGAFPSFAACFYESMSGYTTTGSSVIADVESLPTSILWMRSFSHWLGGMGIIVLSVAILPELAVGGMQLFSAEVTGIDSDKLAPRIAATARRLWSLYFFITAILALFLVAGDMDAFDAVNHAMSTVSTGGFSTRTASIAHYDSLYIELVIVAFMWIAGLSFSLQYRAILLGQPGRLWRSPEVRLYAIITLVAIALFTIDLWLDEHLNLGESLRLASFHSVSLLSTTGFATADYDTWPDFSRLLMLGVMFIGGCAGSTAGGFKVVRLYVLAKHALAQTRRLVRPRLVQVLHIGEREVSRESTEGVLGYGVLFFALILILGLGLTALGMNVVAGGSAAVSVMSSVGPAMGTLDAAENHGNVPDLGLYLLSAGMLLGRLEIYPILVLFSSHFWRRG